MEMNVRNAQIKIAEMTEPEGIRSFVSGDERKTVIDAAHKRIIELIGKSGETGPITEARNDFKVGVQGVKSTDNTDGEVPEPIPVAKSYVTCEDALKNLRAKGYKV
jgi:hypothetical protein